MIVWCMHVSIDVWILISFGVAVLSFILLYKNQALADLMQFLLQSSTRWRCTGTTDFMW